MQTGDVNDNPGISFLSKQMDVNLMVNENGRALLLHDQPWPQELSWAEYDMEMNNLVFVSEEGELIDIGFIIHPPIAKCLRTAEQMYIARVVDGKPVEPKKALYRETRTDRLGTNGNIIQFYKKLRFINYN